MEGNCQHGRLSIVLVNTRNPLNIGAAARAMSNFGFTDLRVVKPFEASFREARSAVGASQVLVNAREFPSVAEAVADCVLVVGTTAAGRRELQHPLTRLEQGARLIRKQLLRGRVALLFGSEKRGLSNEDLSHCHWLLRIPTREEHGSMNLGQAVAVGLYEMSRGATVRETKRPPARLDRSAGKRRNASDQEAALPATSAQLERITTMLLDALRTSGYLEVKPSAKTEKIRRMVRRLTLSSADAELLLGMVRQVLWKIGSSTNRSDD
jgi:TrmH family RNA methyltransferase